MRRSLGISLAMVGALTVGGLKYAGIWPHWRANAPPPEETRYYWSDGKEWADCSVQGMSVNPEYPKNPIKCVPRDDEGFLRRKVAECKARNMHFDPETWWIGCTPKTGQ
jgi:hypothetical protein